MLGTGVARVLERNPEVDAISGIDLEPPRRWMRRADFHFARPGDQDRIVAIAKDFEPTVIVHAWVFEPRSRSSPGQARARTVAGTESLLAAAAATGTVKHMVVRSSASVYGAGVQRSRVAGVNTSARPTTNFGHMSTRVEDRCITVGRSLDSTVAIARLGSVMASHLPNPLGRFLSLPIVPVPITAHRFGLVHLVDASIAMAALATSGRVGIANVMAPDPVTPSEAIRIGNRVPLPVIPAAFRLGRHLAEIPGTPLPEHLVGLLTRGQLIAPCDLSDIGFTYSRSTRDALRDLYNAGRLIDLDVERLRDQAGVDA